MPVGQYCQASALPLKLRSPGGPRMESTCSLDWPGLSVAVWLRQLGPPQPQKTTRAKRTTRPMAALPEELRPDHHLSKRLDHVSAGASSGRKRIATSDNPSRLRCASVTSDSSRLSSFNKSDALNEV